MYAGQRRRDRRRVHDLRLARATRTRRAAWISLARAGRRQRAARADPGPAADPDQPAARVRVPPALPALAGRGPCAGRTSRAARDRRRGRRSPLGVPLRGRARERAVAAWRPEEARRRERHRGGGLATRRLRVPSSNGTDLLGSRTSSSTSRSRPASSAIPSGRCARSTASTLSIKRARRSASSASPGCGKTTLGRTILQLIEPTVGLDRLRRRGHHDASSASEMRPVRRDIQIVFQDPYASLNPRMTVRDDRRRAAADPQALPTGESGRRRVEELLRTVGLNPGARATASRTSSPAGSASASASPARSRSNPKLHRARRAGLRARRVDPGAGRQPARGPAGRARADVPVHRARPVGRAPHLRPGRGDVPRQDRRDRDPPSSIYERADASVHAGAALGRADRARPSAEARQRIVLEGDVPSPVEPAVGLPVPHALLEGAGRSARRRSRRSSTAGGAIPSRATSPRSRVPSTSRPRWVCQRRPQPLSARPDAR